MRGIIIQQAGGPFIPLLDLGMRHWGPYAAQCGLDYWALRNDIGHGLHHNWDRIALLGWALDMGYEWVCWADVDTIPVRQDQDITQALTTGQIGMCWHDVPFGNWAGHYNVGLIIMRNTHATRALLDAAWAMAPNTPIHEQGALNKLLREDSRFTGLLERLDDQWNSTHRANDCAESAVIRAWHGTGDAAWRLEQMARAVGEEALCTW